MFLTRDDANNFPLGIPPFCYADLYHPERLKALLEVFDAAFMIDYPNLSDNLAIFRAGYMLAQAQETTLLMALATTLGPFVARLFDIDALHRKIIEETPGAPSRRKALPQDPTHQDLLHIRRLEDDTATIAALPQNHIGRDGFTLTDAGMNKQQTLEEIAYCLLCHVRHKDSCRHGLYDKQTKALKQTPLGIDLAGCPLDERISEAHTLRKQGDAIAALAMICVDNPMCPGTGHRICNDCMKACIFQKQQPVDIPQIETHILKEVLALPFGFEIYSLLTRFNPLNQRRPYPLPYHGNNVLVVGMGPAGYTLSHYLLNDGFGVVGIDGLKIEKLPDELTGLNGKLPCAIKNFSTIEEALDERLQLGFGGVAEYGITVRFNKNFLKVIYLTLVRRHAFRCYGGIRFGGTVSLEDAWALDIDHVAIATGAGKPNVVPIKNNMPRGMRAASDFLMGLQLSGAFKKDSLANVQVELPAIVIGGGLTAVDTATELAAYYPVQVEKLLKHVELVGNDVFFATCNTQERDIAQRMLQHADQLRLVRAQNLSQQETAQRIAAYIQQWGGVRIVYRGSLQQSPAYRLNHEELQKALAEGIYFIEHLTPKEALLDAHGHLNSFVCVNQAGIEITLPARCAMIAAGTSPNITYEREYPNTFVLDDKQRFFKTYTATLQDDRVVLSATRCSEVGFFTSYIHDNKHVVSFYGDNHPRYAGNVVKAMASAKHGHIHVSQLFAGKMAPQSMQRFDTLIAHIEKNWLAHVHAIKRLAPHIVDVVVHAPAQARKFKPGQFFRLQNYATQNPKYTMEGLALTGASVDTQTGLLSLVALEMGVSSRLCSMLQPGEEIVLMGPTGTATEIPYGKNILLCGGGLGNAVLFSVGQAMRQQHNRVIYVAGYRNAADVFYQHHVEDACDQVIFCVNKGPLIQTNRATDITCVGNIIDALLLYATHPQAMLPLQSIDHILTIGSDRMMQAVATARHTVLKDYLNPQHTAIASINSPMQCMLKEICAQCLQRHIDPITGAESYVFSCFNQDQDQNKVDWGHLSARLQQNTMLEKITNLVLEIK